MKEIILENKRNDKRLEFNEIGNKIYWRDLKK